MRWRNPKIEEPELHKTLIIKYFKGNVGPRTRHRPDCFITEGSCYRSKWKDEDNLHFEDYAKRSLGSVPAMKTSKNEILGWMPLQEFLDNVENDDEIPFS